MERRLRRAAFMETLGEIASLGSWLRIAGASTMLLVSFVALSHVKVERDGHGKPFKGWAAAGVYESSLRWGIALLACGLLVWGWELGWPMPLEVGLGAVTAQLLLLEGAALLRWRVERAARD